MRAHLHMHYSCPPDRLTGHGVLQEQASSSMRMVADMTARLEAMAMRQSELELRNQVHTSHHNAWLLDQQEQGELAAHSHDCYGQAPCSMTEQG